VKGVVSERDFELRMLRYGGAIIRVDHDARAVQDAEGRVFYHQGGIEDITGHKLVEEALKESVSRYRLLAENVIYVIWTWIYEPTVYLYYPLY